MKKLALLIIACLWLAAPVAPVGVGVALADTQSDFEKGVTAYQAGDYTQAIKWWRTSAEQGHANAQFILGTVYIEGRGVARNYKEAAKWVRKAAEQGVAPAQFILGELYLEGAGVPQDYTEAYKWAFLAQANRFANAKKLVEALKPALSPAQISAAQKEAAALQAEIEGREK